MLPRSRVLSYPQIHTGFTQIETASAGRNAASQAAPATLARSLVRSRVAGRIAEECLSNPERICANLWKSVDRKDE
jgi:hypothetical protein